VIGFIGFGVYRVSTRSQRVVAVERNVDRMELDRGVKDGPGPPPTMPT